MKFCTGVLGIIMIITNTKIIFDITSLSSKRHFGGILGPILAYYLYFLRTVQHVLRNFVQASLVFLLRVKCTIFSISWSSWGALGGILGLILGNVYLILYNCSIFSHETLYRCSWYNYDGHYIKNRFLYHVSRGSFLHIFLYFLRIVQYLLLGCFRCISKYVIQGSHIIFWCKILWINFLFWKRHQ